jgi:hypothetical protein
MVKKYGKGRERTERVKGMSTKELHIRNCRYCGNKEWEKREVFMGSNHYRRSVRRLYCCMKGKEYEENYGKERNCGKGGIRKKGAMRRRMYNCT